MIYRFLIRVKNFILRKIDIIVMKSRSSIATYQLTGRMAPVKVRMLDARAGFRCVCRLKFCHNAASYCLRRRLSR